MITDEPMEVYDPPVFSPGEKVRATKYVKNDGTYPLKEIGEVLVAKGDVGYVRDIGSFLQRFYVYAVEFVDRGTIVGMRGKELVSLDKVAEPVTPPARIEPGP
ncbi:nitrogen fixation protein NifZ [Blastochloris viridis]|uniref:NifZ domain protein n=1 Tax=Blastochloris viridis TaxID=1079 RepID=A0A0H5BCV3_BLAVI|nr:nitrogen fixation protein NifZ [Blastochloris viridis]ALK10054.1 NifZ domain protein [Blastochloris viridis]BAS00026.1 NifZ protein [Blastochloris viridis]CUU42718.1 NifZ domain protein [Blastochloris viridis]